MGQGGVSQIALRVPAIMLIPSGKRRDSVGPGLQLCPDRIVRVRGQAHLVPAERDHIELTIRVVALERGREGLARSVPYRGAPVRRGEGCVRENCRSTGVEAGDRTELPGFGHYDFRVRVLVVDLRHVGFL